MSIAEYQNRTVDLLAFYGGKSEGKQLLSQELASESSSGYITTGIQKLAQRFLIELFTERGSLIYLPTRGCDFMTELRLGSLRTTTEVMASFAASLIDIENNLTAEDSETDPDDERYLSAELLSVSITEDSVRLVIQLTSRGNNTVQFIAPIATTLGK